MISRSSSWSINSIACSDSKILGGVSFSASSAEEDRVLVKCLVLQNVQFDIFRFSVLTHDHTGVNLFAGAYEQGTALLGGKTGRR